MQVFKQTESWKAPAHLGAAREPGERPHLDMALLYTSVLGLSEGKENTEFQTVKQ